jgi:hypothetical protein
MHPWATQCYMLQHQNVYFYIVLSVSALYYFKFFLKFFYFWLERYLKVKRKKWKKIKLMQFWNMCTHTYDLQHVITSTCVYFWYYLHMVIVLFGYKLFQDFSRA